MSNPARYLSIDPGDTTGWATFDGRGMLREQGQIPEADFVRWADRALHDSLRAVIVEDYRNHGHMNQPKWSRNKTSKKIGALETLCELRGIELVLQPNTVKGIGYLWGNVPKPKNHKISHQYDAIAHGVYYLQSRGVIPPGFYLRKLDASAD